MLELIDVSKRYGERQVLAPLTLRIEQAKTHVIVGPSGCGKSTLLRLMMGLVDADSGTIELDGEAVTKATVLSLRRKIGYVIQDGGLFPHMTARGNVCLMADYIGWDSARMDKRLEELRELTMFPADGLDRYPAELSGGQRQRVSLMRALMLDPELLLMDEPLGALDPIIRSELQSDLREIFRSLDKTVVLVTHDMGEAAYLGDLIILLEAGRIVQMGTLRELIHTPAEPFVTQFINAQRSPLGDGT